jgi:hypothetical protein
MRHPIAPTIAASAMGLVLLAAGAAAAVPMLGHSASAWWNDPQGLAALPENPQVHYDDGAIRQTKIEQVKTCLGTASQGRICPPYEYCLIFNNVSAA